SPLQLFFQVIDHLADVRVDFHPILDQATGVQNGAVIAAAEGFPNGAERAFGQLPGEEHGDLTGKGNILGAPFAGHVREANVEMLGHSLLDHFDIDGETALFVEHLPQESLDHLNGQVFAGERGKRSHSDQGPLQPADVGANPVGEEVDDIVRQFDPQRFFLLPQNGHSRFHVGRLQVGYQAPLKARNQPLFEVLDFAGGPVAGQHDLFVDFVQRIECVEKLLLDAFFAGKELDVVDQKHVGLAIFFSEANELLVLDGVDVFVREFFRGDVGDA